MVSKFQHVPLFLLRSPSVKPARSIGSLSYHLSDSLSNHSSAMLTSHSADQERSPQGGERSGRSSQTDDVTLPAINVNCRGVDVVEERLQSNPLKYLPYPFHK
ncbi:hypothetical protein LWI28_023354 [Acer negundo]|uniref:Uncharacterized protein n=1 Tax=Acer negundo TaxID=4023 RepID=A0AAD5NIS3_ACENE|nr:hypothetical protein LWI28_023354 [Acer negundo]